MSLGGALRNLLHEVRTPKGAEAFKPCGCPAPGGYLGHRPPKAEEVGEHTEPRVEEDGAATVTYQDLVKVFRCRECGEEWEHNTGIRVDKTVEWHEEGRT